MAIRTTAAVSVLGLLLVSSGEQAFAEKDPKKGGKAEAAAKTAAAAKAAEAQQKSAERERLEAAITDLKDERYATAAVALYEISDSQVSPDIKDEAEYNLAKALYRMKLPHASLSYFTEIMSRGPSGRFYRSALEWTLFIARKVVADERVLESVAKYSDGAFPEEYKSEFRYNLARYHYLAAMAIESGASEGALGEVKVEESITGGKSLGGDVFGDDSGDEGAEEEETVTKKSGGISVDEDIFGDDADKAEKKPEETKTDDSSDKGKKKKKKKKKKGGEASEDTGFNRGGDAIAKKTDPAPGGPKGADAAPPSGELSAKEHLEAAKRLVTQVDDKSPFYPRAKFLEGVILYKEGEDTKQHNAALESFKTVVRLTKPGAPQADEDLRQQAFFQLARTHFGAQQPSFSIYYYDKIERLTYDWLEAIYESSWAEFRLGNYEKALGNLLTLHSPFFENEYFPESFILKAVVYYENCRYPEAKAILTDFKTRYEPVLDELKKLTGRDQAPDKWYETLATLKESETADTGEANAKILGQILQLALTDRDLDKLDASYQEVHAELESYKDQGELFAGSRLRSFLEQKIGSARQELLSEAGRAVKRKLDAEREQIKVLIQQALRIDIETARGEQDTIEAKLRGVETGPGYREKEFLEYADDEKIVWPFGGEYWRDELGTYELTLAHSCK